MPHPEIERTKQPTDSTHNTTSSNNPGSSQGRSSYHTRRNAELLHVKRAETQGCRVWTSRCYHRAAHIAEHMLQT